jgi:mono/diheme cytochrome c family protein
MAATDQHYRHQKTLDIVFAVSCVLMLVSVIWMFAQDYYRDFKQVQRKFRDVDEALTERTMLERLPDGDSVRKASEDVRQARENFKNIKKANDRALKSLLAEKAQDEAYAQSVKADYDSVMSLYNIAVENQAPAAITRRRNEVKSLEEALIGAQAKLEKTERNLKEKQEEQKKAEAALSDAEDRLKKIAGDFDRFAKLTAQKRWKIGDTIRNLPVLDGFAAPTKIQQYTLAEYPIDYNFKYVTRFDRCTTCHLGMERPSFDKESLRKLKDQPEGLQDKLNAAQELIAERVKNGEDLGFDPGDLPRKVVTIPLTDSQVNEYCAHPRLDLFVDANSPHPAEKFGCTSCHSGQGSATDFFNASHTPNNAAQKKEWTEKEGWASNHFWDYPMLAKRFVESSCLKCHHQVTDLIRYGNKFEAPKLIKGYNLVRENGCFGCHEIAGIKSSKELGPIEVGPDLRLEPSPPLEAYTPVERVKMLSDPLNPPGTMRKVGPSLYRIVEKTNQQWTREWIRSPRGFRPTTKMPHFYGLSNNHPDVLPLEQKEFPDAEIHAIAYYLFKESGDYLAGKDKYRTANEARVNELREKQKNGLASDAELKLLEETTRRLELDKKPVPLANNNLKDEEGREVTLPKAPEDKKEQAEQITRGHRWFVEKGCMACHSHEGTKKGEAGIPAVFIDRDFAPDLTRIAAKIAPENGDKDAKRRWLVQWILNPKVHHPRTRMPITHLDEGQAADIAAWFLSQPAEGWEAPNVPAPSSETLANLAKVYLLKAPGMTRLDVEDILSGTPGQRKGLSADEVKARNLAPDADEYSLQGPLDEDKLKWYIGRKAITRLGCYGCHEIPGFAAAKPIGTALNDWGKKDPERLAFEDIVAYVKEHNYPVNDWKGDQGDGHHAENGKKKPYEKFFLEALEHHQREGFLHQKLEEPRSYDYQRLRTWDDRLRMPQFKFAHGKAKPHEGETQEHADAREEAEAREAVMTFILGLVAEPVPAKYLNDPSPDRLAEVKGRHVLEKYNCGGCHQIRPGVYEFKRTPSLLEDLERRCYQKDPGQFASEYRDAVVAGTSFAQQNEWTGRLTPDPNRLIAYGVPDPNEASLVRLTEALSFTKKPEDVSNKEDRTELPPGVYQVPASVSLEAPADAVPRSEPFGGTFAELMTHYLKARDPQFFNEYKTQRMALPPPLMREGEKTQPTWLFQFLRNPQRIRPATILRMPRFNMSDEEAMALVNYFAAVDKLTNPGEGLNYPYLAVPQRDEEYWSARAKEHTKRLQDEKQLDKKLRDLLPIWEKLLDERLTDAKKRVEEAKAAVGAAKDGNAKKQAEADLANRQRELDQLQKEAKEKQGPFFDERRRQWEAKESYATDAYRLLANYGNFCLDCHRVGNIRPKNAENQQGPPLDLTWERLRPEWTLRWIANPNRLISYESPMPQNVPRNKVDAKGHGSNLQGFTGTPLEQVTALRDILMVLPKAAEMPENRYHQPAAAQQEEKK